MEGVIIGMYLNIVEYIDYSKQEEFMEMINVTGETEGVLAKFKRECKEEARREIISRLLSDHSLSEVADLLKMREIDILNIMHD